MNMRAKKPSDQVGAASAYFARPSTTTAKETGGDGLNYGSGSTISYLTDTRFEGSALSHPAFGVGSGNQYEGTKTDLVRVRLFGCV